MSRWDRLSVRSGKAEPDGPFEGMPPHLWSYCKTWLSDRLEPEEYTYNEPIGNTIALRLRIERRAGSSARESILMACSANVDLALDVIDAALYFNEGTGADYLRAVLEVGGSVWTVAEDGLSLLRRVSDEEQIAYETALSPADEISNELREAWGNAYGRDPDPSDAWDHAIKAVELSLWPLVSPGHHRATMGSILVDLAKPERFEFRLATSSKRATNIETLIQMLRLMWPNPDRHGTGTPRKPELEEAGNVVQLAVLIVSWIRSGALTPAGTQKEAAGPEAP